MTLDPQRAETLEQLANQLIPADHDRPSASQADVATWHEAVLQARPDLAKPLATLIDSAVGKEPAEFVRQLRANDQAAFGVLTELVCGAYFMNPEVQRAIGYTGQGPHPIDPRVDYMEDGLIESVIKRGPIYRPTPAE